MIARYFNYCLEYSLFLIMGVIVALVSANFFPSFYDAVLHHTFFSLDWFNLHFIVNDIFMVFFFGVAAKEIVESLSPGGSLNPVKNAISPLLGTIGGVVGPIATFFLFTFLFGEWDLARGWGIPTATDIALAWLAAKIIFGKAHPAINFLLLLAIVDDAIGLGIIALFYGNPDLPVNPVMLLFILLGMGVAYVFRQRGIVSWPLYVFIPGVLAWHGLHAAHLHPSLALVAIVPFIPTADSLKKRLSKFDNDKSDALEKSSSSSLSSHDDHHHCPLNHFEHTIKPYVDVGLFFFAFVNAGVGFSSVSNITWIIFLSLLIGKTVGIVFFSGLGVLFGVPLPQGMRWPHLVVVGVISGLGLTVALFVSGAAFISPGPLAYAQGPAKMGALMSVFAFLVAYILAKIFKIERVEN